MGEGEESTDKCWEHNGGRVFCSEDGVGELDGFEEIAAFRKSPLGEAEKPP